MFSTLRNASRTTTAVIAVGILATLGVDIATAAQGGSGTAVAAARSHPGVASDVQHYLDSVRPIAAQVLSAIAPAEHIAEAIVEPRPGSAFAARDAVVHGGTINQMRTASAALAHLKAPATMAADQRQMVAAAGQLTRTMEAFRGLTSIVNGTHLVAAIDRISSDRLSAGEGNWNVALIKTFDAAHESVPRNFSTGQLGSAVTHTSWVFHADEACSAASYKLAGISKLRGVETLAAAEQWDRLWAKAFTFVSKRIGGLKRPTGAGSLPRVLQARLKLLGFNARLFNRQITGLKHESLSQVERTDAQIRDAQGSLRVLAQQLNSYGAESCGLVIGMWGGKLPAGSHHSHHASVSA